MSCPNLNCDQIDIVGLCDPTTLDLDSYPYWNETSVPESLVIPEQKPDIEQILSVNMKAEIIRKKVIVTPKSDGENKEGKILTGRKLILEGQLVQAISYTADLPEQPVHTAHFAVPFSAFIVIPEKLPNPTTGTDTLNVNFQLNTCIEDVFVIEICKRQIFENVTLLIQAVPAPMVDCLECTGNCQFC